MSTQFYCNNFPHEGPIAIRYGTGEGKTKLDIFVSREKLEGQSIYGDNSFQGKTSIDNVEKCADSFEYKIKKTKKEELDKLSDGEPGWNWNQSNLIYNWIKSGQINNFDFLGLVSHAYNKIKNN